MVGSPLRWREVRSCSNEDAVPRRTAATAASPFARGAGRRFRLLRLRSACPAVVALAALVALCVGGAVTAEPAGGGHGQLHAALRAIDKPKLPAQLTGGDTRSLAAKVAGIRDALPAVRVAVVDSGVTPVGPLASRVVPGANFAGGSDGDSDGNGHGTAMADIVAAGCPSCALVPVRVLGSAGMGTTELAAEGVRWAAANGARVINLSLTMSGPDEALTTAIEDAVSQGAVVVIAAGNSGSTSAAAQGYPGASTPDALVISSADNAGRLYPWANHGAWVHLAAPGVVQTIATNGQPIAATGTSASAAYVSGLVGRLLSCNPALAPAAIRTILQNSGTPVLSFDGGQVSSTTALRTATPTTGCAA